MNFVDSLSLFHVDAKEIPCLTGKGAPTAKTEGAPGVLYMDTDTGALYKCRAADPVNEAYTWEEAVRSDSSQNPDLTGVVKSVNGVAPDENGNVEISVSGGSGGISTKAANLLIAILRDGMYGTDQSANITALDVELQKSGTSGGGGSGGSGTDTIYYGITNNLTGVFSSNGATYAEANTAFETTLTKENDFSILNVTVTMGGADVTADVYADGVISIEAVTNNVVITAYTAPMMIVSDAVFQGSVMEYRTGRSVLGMSTGEVPVATKGFTDTAPVLYPIPVPKKATKIIVNSLVYNVGLCGLVYTGTAYNQTVDSGWLGTGEITYDVTAGAIGYIVFNIQSSVTVANITVDFE